MTAEDLKLQIEKEKQEIENAPKIPILTGNFTRCSQCGTAMGLEDGEIIETISLHGRDLKRRRCSKCIPKFLTALDQHLATCEKCAQKVVITGVDIIPCEHALKLQEA